MSTGKITIRNYRSTILSHIKFTCDERKNTGTYDLPPDSGFDKSIDEWQKEQNAFLPGNLICYKTLAISFGTSMYVCGGR